MSTKTSVRRISALLLFSLLLAILAGCQPAPAVDTTPATTTGTSGTTSEPPKDEPVSLTLWSAPYGSVEGQQPGEWLEKNLAKAWNEKYPNVTVEVELIPYDGINEKMTTAITSGKTPDVYSDTPDRILAYANMGAIATLDDILPADKLEKIRANPDVMRMVSVNGEIVVMPWATGATLMLLNKTIWKNAGAEHLLPQNAERTWTPDQFLEALRAVKDEKNGVYGITLFAINEQGDQLYNNMMAGFGVKLFNADHSRYIAAEDPAALEAMRFFKTIVDEKLCHPYPETLTSTDALDYFKQGKNATLGAAALAHVDIVVNGLADGSIEAPFEPMLVNYPSVIENQATLRNTVGSGCVFKSGDAKKEEWAKKFLYWMFAEDDTVYNVTKGMDAWGTKMAWVDAIENPVAKAEAEYMSYVQSKTSEWPLMDTGSDIVGFPEMRAAMFPEMQSMFIGRSTPEQTLETLSEKFNAIIAKYN